MFDDSGDSPVSNDGCGLKLDAGCAGATRPGDSPVSNDGCGLKRSGAAVGDRMQPIHPSAMTGVG